jgi:hypothetical protein
MRPFEPKSIQSIIASTVTACVLVAVAVFIVSLILTASRLSHTTGDLTGPLQLVQLSKQPIAEGGYAVSMRIGPGLPLYLTLVSAVALAAIAVRLRTQRA